MQIATCNTNLDTSLVKFRDKSDEVWCDTSKEFVKVFLPKKDQSCCIPPHEPEICSMKFIKRYMIPVKDGNRRLSRMKKVCTIMLFVIDALADISCLWMEPHTFLRQPFECWATRH